MVRPKSDHRRMLLKDERALLGEVLADPDWLADVCELPAATLRPLLPYYLPLARDIAQRRSATNSSLLVGVQGPQGAGKSTLVKILAAVLERLAGLQVALLSIDDIYLTRAQRRALAERVHPLFITRGVPGTHDIPLGVEVLESLTRSGPTAIPRFDKAIDDRIPEANWPVVRGPCDVVLFEGLWIGLPPIPPSQLDRPFNALEEHEDADGTWRRHSNDALATEYPSLFARCELLVHLQVPDFACVRRWRSDAEHKLRARLEARGADTSRVMDEAALGRFFAHYERFTAHAMATLPDRADAILRLDRDHRVVESTRFR